LRLEAMAQLHMERRIANLRFTLPMKDDRITIKQNNSV
jgi:hypothetical protein